MKCPKCGKQQPPAPACVGCGVVVAKYIQARQARHGQQRPGGATPAGGRSNKEQLDAIKAEARQAVLDAKQGVTGLRGAVERAWELRPVAFGPRTAFFQEFGALLEAGLPLSECFAGLSVAARFGRMGPVVADLERRTERGQKLWQAMATVPNAFDRFECRLVELGMTTGQAAPVFAELSARVRSRGTIAARVIGDPRRSALLVAAALFCIMVPLPIESVLSYVISVAALAAVVGAMGCGAVVWSIRVLTDDEARGAALEMANKIKPLVPLLSVRRNADLFTFMAAALRTGIAEPKALALAGEVSDDAHTRDAVKRAVAAIDPKTWMAGAAKELPGLTADGLRAFDPESGDLAKSMKNQAASERERLTTHATKIGRAVHYGLALLLAAIAFLGT